MDLLAISIGLIVGVIVGFAIAWFWTNSTASAKKSAESRSESELKGLLALQAKNHLDVTRQSIQNLENELNRLLNSVKEYEQSLDVSNEDYSKNTFFGEHASMFLRNTDSSANKTTMTENIDDQPKDFANSGSGVFVGTPDIQAEFTKEKSAN